jgi:hypothetical protein
VQRTVDGKRPSRDREYSVLGNGKATRDMWVRHGARAIWWKCFAPLLYVRGVVRMEIWPRQNLGDIGRVVGPATHHAVMRLDNFLRDLYQMAHPVVV